MTEQFKVIRDVEWKEVFPFTRLFTCFRVAIHPSKLGLAFVALLGFWVGGNLLDSIWLRDSRAIPGEVQVYESSLFNADPASTFAGQRDGIRAAVRANYTAKLSEIGKSNGGLSDIKYDILQTRSQRVSAADADLAKAVAAKADAEQLKAARDERDQRVRRAYEEASEQWRAAKAIDGVGLFDAICDYELTQIYHVINASLRLQFLGPDSVGQALVNACLVAPTWAFSQHWLYFSIFGIYLLTIRSIFGGAIVRIAAVHVARDEKISIRQALAFSVGKFLSFFSAPLIPLLLVLVAGLVLALGGVLGNIPGLGPIVVGAAFVLALILAFVMTLIILGTLGGYHLMYPTIAVEGSDSFDAISRSFSYVYARPWRLAFYTIVALIYGALTFLFVRLFVLVMLSIAHYATGMLIYAHADNTLPLWTMMWTSPVSGGRFLYDIDFLTLGAGQSLGAALMAMWVYLTIGLLGAFGISFLFSASTIIYFLMRREVDATELDDVYLEQSEEEFAEPEATVVESIGVVVTETPPAGETPGPS